MEAAQPVRVPRQKSRQYLLRSTGKLAQELRPTSGRRGAFRITYKGLHLSAAFSGLAVRRRGLFRTDIWLVDPELGPIAVAVRKRWPLGIRYLVEWDGGTLLLVGGRSHYRWEVFSEDEIVGELSMRPASDSEVLVSLPPGTPDDVAGFVVVVTEMARHHPALRFADRLLQAKPIS